LKIDLNFIKHYQNTNQTTHTHTHQAKHVSLYQQHDPPHRHALRHGRRLLASQVLPKRQTRCLGPLRPPRAKEVGGFFKRLFQTAFSNGFFKKSLAKNIHFYYKFIYKLILFDNTFF